MMSLAVIKLGGSAITFKNSFKKARLDVIENISLEIKRVRDELKNLKMVIVLGGGSFGHPLAKKYSLHKGVSGEKSLFGISETIDSMRELSLIVTKSLRSKGLEAVPIQPSAIAVKKGGKLEEMYLENVRNFLDLGLIPVLWGDVAYDKELGCSILSGDEIVSKISIEFKAEIVVYGLEVDGIFKDPSNFVGLIKTISDENINEIFNFLEKPKGEDVTGGMLKKIIEAMPIYEAGIPVYFINITKPGNLYRVIVKRENVGTLLYKEKT